MNRQTESPENLAIQSLDEDAGAWRKFKNSRFAFAVRHNPMSVLGLAILFLLILMGLWPELFTSQSATLLNLRNKFLDPSPEHPFGTDHMGVDIFSRVVYAARTTIWVVCVVLSIATGLGFVIGSLAAYLGGRVRQYFDALDGCLDGLSFARACYCLECGFGKGLVSNGHSSWLFLVAFLCAAGAGAGHERQE